MAVAYRDMTVISVSALEVLVDTCVSLRARAGDHCPGCRRGGVEGVEQALKAARRAEWVRTLEWSDRAINVPDNVFGVADGIVSCALDHGSDRGNGVPCGMSSAERDACLPVVAKHLSAVNPQWLTHSVDLDESQRLALFADLVAALIKSGGV